MDPIFTLNLDDLTVETFNVDSLQSHESGIVETGCDSACTACGGVC
jgi:hypothetical protein